MAQNIAYWQNLIIGQLNADNISVSGSRTSIRRKWTYAIAFCAWMLDMLFDLHKAEVDTTIAELKPHTRRWYKTKALAFQYGYDLVDGTDTYDNTGFTDDQVEESKIIKYCAVDETLTESRVIIKIATETDGQLAPINMGQYDAFAAYIAEVKDAGVKTTVINYLPDRLYLAMQIYYDPLVLDGEGNSIVAGGRPVEAAIDQYLRELPFNGELVIAHLVDRLQAVSGVAIPHVQNVQSSWVDGATNAYGPITTIEVKKVPESGYFTVVDFDNITYVPNV